MYAIAVLMPYINSFARSVNLEGSGNFATSCEGEPKSPTHCQRAAPPKNSELLRTEQIGNELPG